MKKNPLVHKHANGHIPEFTNLHLEAFKIALKVKEEKPVPESRYKTLAYQSRIMNK